MDINQQGPRSKEEYEARRLAAKAAFEASRRVRFAWLPVAIEKVNENGHRVVVRKVWLRRVFTV